MAITIRALIVEDNEDDAMLLLRELRKSDFEPVFERVETPYAMKSALTMGGPWDVIISDHTLPHMNSSDTLMILKETGLDIPFIIVSGTLSEEVAVEAMKAGAHDFISKDNLVRFVPVIM
ncbi:MAG: response regulator, partial [bacterium]